MPAEWPGEPASGSLLQTQEGKPKRWRWLSSQTWNIVFSHSSERKNCLILLLELPFASMQPKLERGKIGINPEKWDQGNTVNVFLVSTEALFLPALAHTRRPRAAGSPCSSDCTSPPGHVHVQLCSSPHSCPTSEASHYVSTVYIPTSPGSWIKPAEQRRGGLGEQTFLCGQRKDKETGTQRQVGDCWSPSPLAWPSPSTAVTLAAGIWGTIIILQIKAAPSLDNYSKIEALL